MHPLIETHRRQIVELARRRGIVNVRVFGSMARGDAGADSDVDLLVTLPPRGQCAGPGRAADGRARPARPARRRGHRARLPPGIAQARAGILRRAMKPDFAADSVLIAHMRECLALIAEYTANDRARFDGSRMVQDAVVRKLQTLTESSQRLSSTLCLNPNARRTFGAATQLCKQGVKQWLTQLDGLA